MKYLIFSDTHLDKNFDSNKLDFLIGIIKNSDRVIIAGDFWESLAFTFDEFLNSPWKKLFPYLKQKKTIYVYGNHDPQKKMDMRVSLFSNKLTGRYVFESGNKTFFVEHGAKTDMISLSVIRKLSVAFGIIIHRNPRIAHQLEKFIFTILGRNVHQLMSKRMNDKIKNERTKEFTGNNILICGHSHHQELDLKHNYIGCGFINFGLGQYILINNGEITLKEVRYK